MKPTSHPFLALLMPVALASCVADGAATGPNPLPGGGTPLLAKAAGAAVGQAVDASGKVLADVNVDLNGKVTENGKFQAYQVKTDATGRYRQADITPGLYKVNAWREVSYNGRTYQLPLWSPQGPHNEELASKDGIVRDFVFKISGPKPGAASTDGHGAFYGGTVQIYGADYIGNPLDLPTGTQLSVKLVPDGPLLDGSTGHEVSDTAASNKSGSVALKHLTDVPLGRYTVTAVAILTSGGNQAVRVATKGGIDDADFKAQATLDFEPETGASIRPYQEHPTRRAAVYMKL